MRLRPPLHEVGADPDYRFTLSNERTLRTGLATMGGGALTAHALGAVGPGGRGRSCSPWD